MRLVRRFRVVGKCEIAVERIKCSPSVPSTSNNRCLFEVLSDGSREMNGEEIHSFEVETGIISNHKFEC